MLMDRTRQPTEYYLLIHKDAVIKVISLRV